MGLSKTLRMLAATTSAAGMELKARLSGRVDPNRVQLKPGDPAPDFVLPGSDGRLHHLRDFRGREAVIIAWFPKAFTPMCTRECASLGSSRGVLRGFKAKYFAASVDPVETNRQFAEALGVDYPILSDPDKTIARAYGVLEPAGLAARWTFYIGMDGRLLDIDKQVHAASHGRDVAEKLGALRIPGGGTRDDHGAAESARQ